MTIEQILVQIIRYTIPSISVFIFWILGFGVSNKKKTAIVLTTYMLFMIIASFFIINFLGYSKYKKVFSFIAVVANTTTILLISKYKFPQTLFCFMTISIVNISLNVLCNGIRYSFDWQSWTMLIILPIIYGLVVVLMLKISIKPIKFMVERINEGWFSLLILPAITIFIILYLTAYSDVSFGSEYFALTGLTVLLGLCYLLYIGIFFHNLTTINELAEKEIEDQAQILSAKAIRQELDSYDIYLRQAKQNRHDLRHHNAILFEYLKNDDKLSAMEYLKQYDDSICSVSINKFCQNKTANAILSLYDKRACDAEFGFSALAHFPETLPLKETEIGVVISNLLENAFEACQLVENSSKYIAFSSIDEDEHLMIEVRNSMNGVVNFVEELPQTTKKNGGIGTRSVKSIVEKYKGIIKFSQEKNEFIVRILIPLA